MLRRRSTRSRNRSATGRIVWSDLSPALATVGCGDSHGSSTGGEGGKRSRSWSTSGVTPRVTSGVMTVDTRGSLCRELSALRRAPKDALTRSLRCLGEAWCKSSLLEKLGEAWRKSSLLERREALPSREVVPRGFTYLRAEDPAEDLPRPVSDEVDLFDKGRPATSFKRSLSVDVLET
ncbi:unnamed protein product [Darwinula stevensoni]|uniref:Uncharacterized protein n=1 Tax=Darwinula stevensoni TaxID=69355 RepID=A0A7R9A7N6_9CRUS|nr:unnamed protein product [Darwinula stevensoni]CAG0892728.1 unnamed protein product [Darwinula stevensoni]